MNTAEKKVKTFRELSEQEIELMNELKTIEETLLDKVREVSAMRQAQKDYLTDPETFGGTVDGLTINQLNESQRCLGQAINNIQQGSMWAVRGIALPVSVEAV